MGIFQQQIFSHKSPTLLWVWLEGVRMAPISRRGHTMAHRANQGLNQRLFLLSMTTGSSLSTASQILIWGFVISQSSFPCQQIRSGKPRRMVTDKTMSTAPNRLNGLFPRLSVIGLALIVWKVATNPEGAAKTQLFKKSPSRYPWSKMQNGQQNAGRSATLEIYALLLGMGKWRGTSAKAIQGVPKGIKRTDTKKSAEKSRESGS